MAVRRAAAPSLRQSAAFGCRRQGETSTPCPGEESSRHPKAAASLPPAAACHYLEGESSRLLLEGGASLHPMPLATFGILIPAFPYCLDSYCSAFLRKSSEVTQSTVRSRDLFLSRPVSGGARLQRRIGVIIWSTGA
jgi:hypothetical protein